MRFVLKERLFSIRNESGNEIFEVTGSLISLRDHLTLRDRQGNILATITHKVLALRPVYTISRPDQPDAKVKKDFINILREGFSVDMAGGLPDMRIQGDILVHNYTITRDGVKVAEASQKWISSRDSYSRCIQGGRYPADAGLCHCSAPHYPRGRRERGQRT